ncbi:MAG: glycerophosphodiester phosphodiesterase [Clostridia bacterium]|nr:glycerophosphodiester phosphodiesterase [Clostridia bacterium]
MKPDENFWLFTRPIAHRGLWGNGIVENSLTAYKNAADNGYPIEIDLFLTADNEIVTFHDDTLTRLTGASGRIYDKTLAELKTLSLAGTEEKIPTLKEVLALVSGRVPLLIEIKDQPNDFVVDIAVEILKNYKGEFALQSFNPFYIKRIKKIAPDFTRGILGTHKHEKERGRITNFVLQHLPFNFMIKPDFISYEKTGLKHVKRKAKRTPVIAWTVTTEEEKAEALKVAKNIIFEHFVPKK